MKNILTILTVLLLFAIPAKATVDNDFEKAKAIVMAVCEAHNMVLDDPAPMVRVSEHGQSSVNLTARVWVKSGDYWTVKFDILEAVKTTFDKSGITIPYNQLDVHVKKD